MHKQITLQRVQTLFVLSNGTNILYWAEILCDGYVIDKKGATSKMNTETNRIEYKRKLIENHKD